ncbi:MAG: hypothetical protein GC190_16005 [Alphaproteobacteria bacterium]|nr:hypothetical protein [Alphaproteobacteria bacterium]
MTPAERTIKFREREFKGSRLRCLLLTSAARSEVAAFLNSLVAPHARVTAAEHWMPRGFLEPDEAKLGETPGFLSDQDRATLTGWWLKQPGGANTPNWDLVSTCSVETRPGLVLVEAKAHEGEFSDDRCGASSPNRQQIEAALAEASAAWNELMPGFSLSADSHYQLSNRLAFSWKLASMGIPIVVVYLGFLDAHEMDDGRRTLLRNHMQWHRCVVAQSKDTIPEHAWDRTFDVGGTPLTIAIRSAVVDVHTQSASSRVTG